MPATSAPPRYTYYSQLMNAQSHDRPGVAVFDFHVLISIGLMPIPPDIQEVEDLISLSVKVMVILACNPGHP